MFMKDNKHLSAHAMGALASLSLHAKGQKALNEMNATATTVQAMGYHLSSLSIQKCGCTLLSNCSSSKSSKFMVSPDREDAVNAVIRAMLCHDSMMKLGCSILRKHLEQKINVGQCEGFGRLFKKLEKYAPTLLDAKWIVKRMTVKKLEVLQENEME
jgi:hypothetical protein